MQWGWESRKPPTWQAALTPYGGADSGPSSPDLPKASFGLASGPPTRANCFFFTLLEPAACLLFGITCKPLCTPAAVCVPFPLQTWVGVGRALPLACIMRREVRRLLSEGQGYPRQANSKSAPSAKPGWRPPKALFWDRGPGNWEARSVSFQNG